MIYEDTSRFRYTNPIGHPSGLRISRIISESFRLGLPDVRWFVLGDDDTIFNADNLVSVLIKHESSQTVYGLCLAMMTPFSTLVLHWKASLANTCFSHFMTYGGGGIAIIQT
ncbi:hypothetical protein M5689_012878 [Euphorbia peplus]|nr:hypothetical protein M5689_012878 [Euphorbia peplus]